MGRPEDDIRDRLHRDEFEKEEEEELLEDEEGFDDLIGQHVDNAAMAGTAQAIRAHRVAKEQESELNDEMFDILEEQKFTGAPPPLADHQHTTADEPDEEGPPPLAAAPEDEEEGALPIGAGESWSSDAAPAPAATEPMVGSSDWLKSDG